MAYWTDFDTYPLGGGNPYHACVGCDRSVPELNGDINKHHSWCTEVAKYHAERNADIEVRQDMIGHYVHVSGKTPRGVTIVQAIVTSTSMTMEQDDAKALCELAHEAYGVTAHWCE